MPRLLLAVLFPLALGTCVVAVLVQLGFGRDGPGPAPRPVPRPAAVSVTSREEVAAVQVLHEWDRARAQAWEDLDVAALDRLYVPGSSAGRHDVTLLRGFVRRGLQARDVRRQVWGVTVLAHDDDRWLLRVRDRVLGVRDDLAGWRIDLRRTGSRWQVLSVRRVPSAAPPTPRGP